MFDILSITGVIFILMGVGYGSVRLGAFSARDMEVLGRFVVNIALPALILRAIATRPFGDIVNVGYLGGVLAGSLLVFWGGYAWSRRALNQTAVAATFNGMGMSCANSGFIGYPVLLMALPEIAATALALNMIVETLIMIPMALVMAERTRGDGARGARLVVLIAGRLARNPILLALIAGLVVSLSGLTLPVVLARPIDILASASAAVSLVVIGGTLASLSLRRVNGAVFAVVLGKLALHPLAVALGLMGMAALGFGVGDDRLAAAAIIMAAMPVMTIYPILAQRFGEVQVAAQAMFLMTLAAFPTLTATLALVLP